MKTVGITDDEKKLSYAKYFYMDMAAIPEEKLAVWRGPAADPRRALPVEDRDLFLDEVTPGMETGFCVAENGTGFVANATFMPGVTPEMFDWWFGWHSVVSDLRYKIWDREDHYHARADNPDYVLDPRVPESEKTWGVNHHILEDIGLGAEELLLAFKKPSDMGYDMRKLGGPGCASMVCAYGLSSTPAIMTHKCVKADGGIWFKSRFWMGYTMDGAGNPVKLVPDGAGMPEAAPRALFGHNIKEYANLAALLPGIYAEEKDNWR